MIIAATVLSVLKVLGWILLILLLLVLALILLLLFFPFCYRGKVKKTGEDILTEGKLTWLFGLISAKLRYKKSADEKTESRPEVSVRVFGLPLLSMLKKRKGKGGLTRKQRKELRAAKKKAKEAGRGETWEAKKKPTVLPKSEQRAEEPIEVFTREETKQSHRFYARVAALIGRVKAFFAKLKEIFGNLREWREFLASERFTEGARVIKRQGFAILRHIRPRRLKGRIHFGTEDPSLTGKILGGLGILYPVLPKGLSVEPDFERSGLEADVEVGGHFFGIVLLYRALKILRNKGVRSLMARFRTKKQGGKKDGGQQ